MEREGAGRFLPGFLIALAVVSASSIKGRIIVQLPR